MKKTSKILALVLAVCMISALCACGKTAETPAAEETTSTIPEGGFKIACSTGMGGNTWVAQYNDDFTQHCEMYKEMGLVSDYQIVNTNADLTEQINQCTSLINSGIDCLILWPASTSGVQPIIELAKANDVLVIINNDPAAFEGTYCVCGNTTKFSSILAEWLCNELGGEGNIVRIEGMAGNNSNELRVPAEDEVIAKYPGITTLASGNGNYSQTVAQEVMTTFLSTYGDKIDGVLAQDVMGDGILKAYKNAGVTPTVMTGDYLKSYLKAWKEIDGLKSCSVTYDAWIGCTALDVALNLLQGKTFKDGVLQPNPADESMINAIVVDPAYVVTLEGDQNAPWMEGLTSKAITLDEALELLADKDDTAALDGGLSTEEVAALFN